MMPSVSRRSFRRNWPGWTCRETLLTARLRDAANASNPTIEDPDSSSTINNHIPGNTCDHDEIDSLVPCAADVAGCWSRGNAFGGGYQPVFVLFSCGPRP